MRKQKKIISEILCVLILVLLIVPGLFSINTLVSASTTEEDLSGKAGTEAEVLYVQINYLAVRPAKNSTELLGRLLKGDQVTGYRDGVWIRITYGGQTAYIAAKYTDTNPRRRKHTTLKPDR